MMNVKISILSLVLMAGATSLFADNNDKGIDYYKAGMYSYAKKALFENIQSGKTDKAEAYYYLGEIYAAENMKDSAAYCYKQGLVADPEYVFNTIGEIKLDLAATPDVDKVLAGFTTGKNKKNPAIFVAIARAYMTDPARKAKVEEYLAKAKEVDLLSGGLNPDSIGALSRFTHPQWAGIDLNSGFELAPGIKDTEALGKFIREFKKMYSQQKQQAL